MGTQNIPDKKREHEFNGNKKTIPIFIGMVRRIIVLYLFTL